MGVEEGTPPLEEQAPPPSPGAKAATGTKIQVDDDFGDSDQGPVKSETSSKKRNLIILLAVGLVLAAVLIGVLVGADNNDSNSSSSSSSNSNKKNDNGEDPNPTTPGVDSPTLAPVANEEDVEYFTSSVGPFDDLKIPLETSKILTYTDETEMKDDFTTMCQFLISNVAQRGLGDARFVDAAFGFPEIDVDFVTDAPSLPNFEEGRGDDAGDGDGGDQDNPDDYGTNNQEGAADEADVSKSDGTFIYSLLGNHLMVIRADDKEMVAKIELPPVEMDGCTSSGPFPVDPALGMPEPLFDVYDPCQDSSSYKPRGVGLLLSENRLAVIAAGYASGLYMSAVEDPFVISQYHDTLVQLYSLEKLNTGEDLSGMDEEEVLPLVAQKYLNGGYTHAYMVGTTAIIITNSYLNNMITLARPFERFGAPYAETTDAEYMASIKEDSPEIIGKYITKLFEELQVAPGVSPSVVKLGLPTSSVSDEDAYTNADFGDGYASYMVATSTFDMEDTAILVDGGAVEVAAKDDEEIDQIDVQVTVQFMANGWVIPYANGDDLILAAQGYAFNALTQASEDRTILNRYSIIDGTVTPESRGTVPGSLLSRRSIDAEGDQLRVATTLRKWRPFSDDSTIIIRPGQGWWGGFEDAVLVDEATGETAASGGDAGRDLMSVTPEVASDLTILDSCSDLPAQCSAETELVARCDEVAGACQGNMILATGACLVFCEETYMDSQCHHYLIQGIDAGDACVNSKTFIECLHLDATGCEVVPVGESCPTSVECFGGVDPTIDPPPPPPQSTFVQVFRCEDATTEACPADAIALRCSKMLADGCEELWMQEDTCNFFCRDRHAGTQCELYFDAVVTGLVQCPLELVKDCTNAVDKGCDIIPVDFDACQFDIDCTSEPEPIKTTDLEALESCDSAVDSCLTEDFASQCSSIESECQEMYYSNETCAIYCRDAVKGGTCDGYLEMALTEGNSCVMSSNLATCRRFESGNCQIEVGESCPFTFVCIVPPPRTTCPSVGEGCMDEAAVTECERLEEDGCEEIMITKDTCEVTCFSRTLNEIFILEDDDTGVLEVKGRQDFGKASEDITAVLYRSDRAYVVTFLRRDPLYVVDLTDSTNPTIMDALDIPGFSSYLHVINDDFILGIGQHTDSNGRPLGMQLSIFDVSDPSELSLAFKYHEPNQWSSAEHDDKSFRYRSEGDGRGTLIIPLRMNTELDDGTTSWFDGFAVFDIDVTTGIKYLYSIGHVTDVEQCYVCASLQMRSFVIDDHIITQKGHSFVSTNMATTEQKWKLPLLQDTASTCCNWFSN